jgi:hypothetical protein
VLRRISIVLIIASTLVGAGCSHSNGAKGRRVPVVARGTALLVVAHKTADHAPCRSGLVRDYETDRCFQIDGAPILRAADIAVARVECNPSPPPIWLVHLETTSAVATRFDRYTAAHPGVTLSIVSGPTLLVSATLGEATFRGRVTIGDMNLTQEDALRVVTALSGPNTTEEDPIPKGAIEVGPRVTFGSCAS